MSNVVVDSSIRAWLAERFPDARLCTETPANLADVLPCVRVVRISGATGRYWTIDSAWVDVDVFAATRDEAAQLSEDIRRAVRADLPGETISTAFVLNVHETSGPTWMPYDNTSVRRYVASYQIRLHNKA